MIHLGAQKMAGIKFLKFQVCLFNDVGAMIFNHDGTLKSPISAFRFILSWMAGRQPA
jgi:hypothetical protein